MDQRGTQSSLPPTCQTRGPPPDAVADIISLAYRVLLPASPVILALGFGLYVPAVLSLENIVNIIQQASFLFVLTCRTNHRVVHSWTGLFLGSKRVDDQRCQRFDNDGGAWFDGCQWHYCGVGRDRRGSFDRTVSRAVQWDGCSMAPRESVRCYTRQHEYLLGYRHIAFRRPSGIRNTRRIQVRVIGCMCWGCRCRSFMLWPSALRSMSFCSTPSLGDHFTCSVATPVRQSLPAGHAAGCWLSLISCRRY